MGYPTSALPQLRNETNNEIKLEDKEGSLFASLFWMVGIFSAPFGGILSGWIGRRKLIIFAAPIVVCGWMVIGLAQNKEMLYAGRIMTSGQQNF